MPTPVREIIPQPAKGTRAPAREVAVIGGGTMGCSIATHLARQGCQVRLFEREHDLCTQASYANQARVHNGYHYPRSVLTGVRSRVNYPRFIARYRDCIDDSFEKVYAIARHTSNVSAAQFVRFCQRIGAPIEPAPASIRQLFDPRLIEAVFVVSEVAFDAVRLRHELRAALESNGVQADCGREATRVERVGHRLRVHHLDAHGDGAGAEAVDVDAVYHCTYSSLNELLRSSSLPVIPLRHELAEMALVEMPVPLRGLGVTVMDGAYFSTMPFPPRGLHTLSHVRYTPHGGWLESSDQPAHVRPTGQPESNAVHMVKDAARYMPTLAGVRVVDSLWATKTVLPASDVDDSRPILIRPNHGGLRNFTCILGGKVDNVFDALTEIDRLRHTGVLP